MKLYTLGWFSWVLALPAIFIDGIVGIFYWASLLILACGLWLCPERKQKGNIK